MLRNEKGFTLIEIIAVLVILGILAAVAIPKYFDLMAQARQNAAQSAIAELKARANNTYAKNLLTNVTPNDCAAIATAIATNSVGDYTVTNPPTCVASVMTITVTSVKTISLAPAVTGTWTLPTT